MTTGFKQVDRLSGNSDEIDQKNCVIMATVGEGRWASLYLQLRKDLKLEIFSSGREQR